MTKPILTAERLREVLDYDPVTGDFTWKRRDGVSNSWNAKYPGVKAGTLNKISGYVHISIDKIIFYSHRLAWLHATGSWPKNKMDHINGDRGDNRLVNLRDVSDNVNAQNQRKAPSSNKSTGVLGVHFFKSTGRFQASIRINGRTHHLGYFSSAEAAHSVYVAAKRKHHEGCAI